MYFAPQNLETWPRAWNIVVSLRKENHGEGQRMEYAEQAQATVLQQATKLFLCNSSLPYPYIRKASFMLITN